MNAQGGILFRCNSSGIERGFMKNENIVKTLFEKGGDMKAQRECHGHAMMAALLTGQENIVKLLVGKSAEANARDELGDNTLKAASESMYGIFCPDVFRRCGMGCVVAFR